MQCTVYLLRLNGHKRDPDSVTKSAVVGTIRMVPINRGGESVLVASFIGSTGAKALPPLYYAGVIKIERGGLLIRGIETVYPNMQTLRCPQTWWCVPVVCVREPDKPTAPEQPAWRRATGMT